MNVFIAIAHWSIATKTMASNIVPLATLATSCIHKAHAPVSLKLSFSLHCIPTYVWYILHIEPIVYYCIVWHKNK